MQNQTVNLLLADAHEHGRIGLRQLLTTVGYAVVAEVSKWAECLAIVPAYQPRLLLLSCNLLPVDAVPAITQLHQSQPETHMVLFPADCAAQPLRALLAAGVRGVVSKTEPPEEMLAILRQVAAGSIGLSGAARVILTQPSAAATTAPASLTAQEIQLLTLLTHGLSNKEIADTLTLAPQTIRNYLSQLYGKIGVSSRQTAVAWAQRSGILDDEGEG